MSTDLTELGSELRLELGLSSHDVLDPYALARLWGIEVVLAGAERHAIQIGQRAAESRAGTRAAMLSLSDGGALIVEQPGLGMDRRLEGVTHALAHVVLEHPTCLGWLDRDVAESPGDEEMLARGLAAELLLPRVEVQRLSRLGVSPESVTQKFGVSRSFVEWRYLECGLGSWRDGVVSRLPGARSIGL